MSRVSRRFWSGVVLLVTAGSVGCGGELSQVPEGTLVSPVMEQRATPDGGTTPSEPETPGYPGLSNGVITLGVSAPARGVDHDGDGKAELVLFRPTTSEWIAVGVEPGAVPRTLGVFGRGGDYPVPADYDGDGRVDLAQFEPNSATWKVNGVERETMFGEPGDIPVPGDYNGDGRADRGFFRPREGAFYVATLPKRFAFAAPGDLPAPGDYDGDGIYDFAVWRPLTGEWFIHYPVTGETVAAGTLGIPGDLPVVADYDGDRKADIAVYRPTTGVWYVRGLFEGQWGIEGDLPAPADYDGDGRVDVAVYRPSEAGFRVFGLAEEGIKLGELGDLPAQAPGIGVSTCMRPEGCTIQSPQTWVVLNTIVRAHLFSGSLTPTVLNAWIQVGECEGGSPWNAAVTDLGRFPRGFRSPDRGPFQISPIHFFHGNMAEWKVVREAWVKMEEYKDNDIAKETDKDVYGFGFHWEQMLDVHAGAEFGVLLAARSQAAGLDSFGPWFKSIYCHGYTQTPLPISNDIVFNRTNDYVHYRLQGKRYVRIR